MMKCDAKKTKSIVAIKPKPPFKPAFQVAVAKQDSEIRILNEPLKGTSVFLMETGESQSLPETRYIVKWLNSCLELQPTRVG
jgi:site-specific DNA recombinase